MKIRCHYTGCKQTIDAPDDDRALAAGPTATVLAAGLTFGHQQYVRVPGQPRKFSGRPWTCPFHEVSLDTALTLTYEQEQQQRTMVAQIRAGKMVKDESGYWSQVPPKPVKPYTVREDNGDLRTTTVKWWTQEQVIAALTPETSATEDYVVNVKQPPAGFESPEVSDDAD
jgi:hypothetical protein